MIKKNSTFPLSAAVATRMTEEIRIGLVFLFFAAALLAQTTAAPAPPVAFEVASIKPAAPLDPRQLMMGQQRVGMKVDAARLDIANLSLADLVRDELGRLPKEADRTNNQTESR
jgi:hypothetical protein